MTPEAPAIASSTQTVDVSSLPTSKTGAAIRTQAPVAVGNFCWHAMLRGGA